MTVDAPVLLAGPVVALAFKLEEGKFGQLTYMRLYSGTLRKGEFLVNTASGKRIKASPRSDHLVPVARRRSCSGRTACSTMMQGNRRHTSSFP